MRRLNECTRNQHGWLGIITVESEEQTFRHAYWCRIDWDNSGEVMSALYSFGPLYIYIRDSRVKTKKLQEKGKKLRFVLIL
jgi:hypothetical protein